MLVFIAESEEVCQGGLVPAFQGQENVSAHMTQRHESQTWPSVLQTGLGEFRRIHLLQYPSKGEQPALLLRLIKTRPSEVRVALKIFEVGPDEHFSFAKFLDIGADIFRCDVAAPGQGQAYACQGLDKHRIRDGSKRQGIE